ncbi:MULTISPECIES: HEPN domain-containing protein [Spirulina sp. CCY15215]|uniref:HEPN domain-containing protein n=1 Tax=Spirulina sp. CCY15215 TaxID=2767591 RepID=UPI001EF39814|nr:HEPN domain-containing protein [Spirulina major]
MTTKIWDNKESRYFDLEELNSLEAARQEILIKQYFYSKYEPPENWCPYIDGEYYFIGGSHDTEDGLSIFEDYIPDSLLQKIINDLNEECIEWSDILVDREFADEQDIDELHGTKEYEYLENSLKGIKKIIKQQKGKLEEEACQVIFSAFYIKSISALEGYLMDVFYEMLFPSSSDSPVHDFAKKYYDNFCDNKGLCSRDQELNSEQIEEIKEEIKSKSWHNLKKFVKPRYKKVLDINIVNSTYEDLLENVKTRHDITHRNSKKVDGSRVLLGSHQIENLVADILDCAKKIDDQIVTLKKSGNYY